MHKFDELISLLIRLRAPDGCAWDRKQTVESMAPKLVEEAQETADAIAKGDHRNLEEELGDLFITICFVANLAQEQGVLTVESCLTHAIEKLIRRHPHVFGEQKNLSVEQVLDQWHKIKDQEKLSKDS